MRTPAVVAPAIDPTAVGNERPMDPRKSDARAEMLRIGSVIPVRMAKVDPWPGCDAPRERRRRTRSRGIGEWPAERSGRHTSGCSVSRSPSLALRAKPARCARGSVSSADAATHSPSLTLRAKPTRCARGSVSSAATKSGADSARSERQRTTACGRCAHRSRTPRAHTGPRTASAASRLRPERQRRAAAMGASAVSEGTRSR